MFDSKCLAFAVRKDECDGEQVILGIDAPKIAEREWPL